MTKANIDTPAQNKSLMLPVVFPAVLALILVAILFPLPQPTIKVNLPFKVESLLVVFTAGILIYLQFNKNRRISVFSSLHGSKGSLSTIIGVFILWSGLSVFWAQSIGSVEHHTLLWSLYLVLFIAFIGLCQIGSGVRTLVAALAFTSMILGVLCVFDYLSVVDFASSEGSLRIRYGKYAELLVTIVPVLWAAAIYSRSRGKMLIVGFAAAIGWVTVLLSLSKGAFIAGVAGSVLFFVGSIIFSHRFFRRRSIIAAAIWLLLTVGTQVTFSAFTSMPSTADYISGKADPTRSTTEMRIYTWTVGRQMAKSNWLTGVGADNFGNSFNAARSELRKASPDIPKDEPAEDYLTERAHNEPLQVMAELGVIGFTIFALFFALLTLVLFKRFWRNGFRLSPMLWATSGGMLAFAISSMVSSFSFRSAQNGTVFFTVAAIALYQLRVRHSNPDRTLSTSRLGLAACWLVIVLFGTYCGTKIFAEYQVYQGDWTESSSAAHTRYLSALTADPEYAGAYLSRAARFAVDGDQAAAAVNTRAAIDHGIGLSLTYSQLAKQQISAGLNTDADETFRRGLSVYPRSVFLRIEYTVFLKKTGRSADAAAQLAIARSIEPRQANGWHLMITEGSIKAFYAAQKDPAIAEPNSLLPLGAVPQYIETIPGS